MKHWWVTVYDGQSISAQYRTKGEYDDVLSVIKDKLLEISDFDESVFEITTRPLRLSKGDAIVVSLNGGSQYEAIFNQIDITYEKLLDEIS